MNFENFLKAVLTHDFWISKQVFCFKGQAYKPLFFDFLWNRLCSGMMLPFSKKSLNVDDIKLSYRSILEQSILGMSNFYWLGEICESGKKDKFVEYLLDYKGPNFVAFFASMDIKFSSAKSNIEIIDIPSNVNLHEFNLVLKMLSIKLSSKKIVVAEEIFNDFETLDLNFACMLINYLEFISISCVDELPEYLAPIIGSQAALNQLSNYFFNLQQKPFFSLWFELESKYPEVFWVSFWSDQVWKAFHVTRYLKNKDFVKAKQVGYGLPFGFINKSWSGFEKDYFYRLYQDLYKIDCALKKGSTFCSLDLFYLKHFNAVQAS